MGGALRTCKDKFYGGVHAGLGTWVGAAREDGWEVRDVKEGGSGSPRKRASPVKGKKGEEAPPKLEVGGLDLGDAKEGGWL